MKVTTLCLVLLCLGAGQVAVTDSARRDSTPVPAETSVVEAGTPVIEGAEKPHGPAWTTGLTFRQHVYLVAFAALLGLAFWSVQRLFEYLVQRNRRHHRAIAELEYILGRQYNLLANNVNVVTNLRATIASGKLSAMFPIPLAPDSSPCIELFNVGLINAVLRVNERMAGLDFNATAFQTLYEKIRDDFVSKPNDEFARKRYEENAAGVVAVYGELRNEMLKTHSELLHVLAWLKILGQRDKPGIRRFLLGKSRRSASVTDTEIEDGVKEIERLSEGPHRFREPGKGPPAGGTSAQPSRPS